MAWTAAEEEDFAGPRARDDVHIAVAVEVHQLGTEADASARRHDAVLFAVFEFDPGRQFRLIVRANIAIYP